MLLDTHFHLDFLPAERQAACVAALAAAGVSVVAQTMRPSSFRVPEPVEVTCASLGFHPWEVGADSMDADLEIFASTIATTRFVGEVGLDFSPRRVATAGLQREAFRRIVAMSSDAARADGRSRILSIHAVRAVTDALDIVEGVDGVVPVIHWFSGTSDELTRLIRAGGYMSVNPAMLSSKRGRAYLRQVPVDRLLLETDLPDESSVASFTPAQVVNSLRSTLSALTDLRGEDVRSAIEATQTSIYEI